MGDVDYCTVLPSWEFDKDPACVVSYAFGKENEKSQTEDSGEGVPDKYNPSTSLILQCQCDDMGEREPCLISVTCKPQYRVSVTGIHVISESKTIEIYDTGEIYLTTIKGRQLQVSEDGDDQPQHNLYRCKTNIKESLYGLSVKFLSFGNKSTLTIYSILLILKPELDGFSPEKEAATGGQINISKVKGFIHDMGDTIPDGARNLLQSMEDYQTNQKTAMSGLQGLMSGGGAIPGDKFGMMGLMSILSQVTSTTGSSRQSNTRTNRQTSSANSQITNATESSVQRENPRNSSENKTVNRESQKTLAGENTAEHNENANGNTDMFKMLQNICGKVTRMREDERKTEEVTANNLTMYDESGEVITVPCPDKVSESETANTRQDTSLMELEQRLKEHIDKEFVKIEEKLNEKLDKMMSMLSVVLESKSKETSDNSSQTINSEDGVDDS